MMQQLHENQSRGLRRRILLIIPLIQQLFSWNVLSVDGADLTSKLKVNVRYTFVIDLKWE
jgi:hypothetical protein